MVLLLLKMVREAYLCKPREGKATPIFVCLARL
jgi:hypothetical protein